MTVIAWQENMPTWTLRCDRCRHVVWLIDSPQAPPEPHICADCWTEDDDPGAPWDVERDPTRITRGLDGRPSRRQTHGCCAHVCLCRPLARAL